jgi:hypothetical protein
VDERIGMLIDRGTVPILDLGSVAGKPAHAEMDDRRARW